MSRFAHYPNCEAGKNQTAQIEAAPASQGSQSLPSIMENKPAALATTAPRTHSSTRQDGAQLFGGQSPARFGLLGQPRDHINRPTAAACRPRHPSPPAIFISRLPSTRCGLRLRVSLNERVSLENTQPPRRRNLYVQIAVRRLRGAASELTQANSPTSGPTLCCLCLMAIFMDRLLM